ncbi:Zn(2)-C6 fungal-type DNA-binding domain protein [Apiospora arundinis]|uniref:Zn(2)-C6 fungal-type DNA-binding domain protein n=1 Tax=Apiospora arundinis TaxID=335852 RepID=A0ABR2JHF9_9PEZI
MDERVQTRAKLPSRACESCRAAKIRCQPSDQAGTCKSDTPLPHPPGPSQTFSIDFSLPVESDLGSNFDDLLEKHEQFLDDLVPSAAENGFDNDSTMISATSSCGGATFSNISSPGSSMGAASSVSLTSLGIKPQFNLNSAQKLLDGFQDMLAFCPLVVLPEGANVKSMAAESPFMLLAILAATSCSSSLQGFNLYDDEFRKVLGLKFVTSGERSLELLQGLLIYNAW